MKKIRRNSEGSILVIVIVIAVVAVGTVSFFMIRNKDNREANTAQTATTQPAKVNIPVSDTEKKFRTYLGEDYDRYFMANMIAHHEGAVDMAKLAKTKAKHTELRTMANDIISAQTIEIDNMLSWQQAWGYPASSGEMMMDHSAMGMMDEMGAMTAKLKSLSGDNFDKKFLELMIEHHMSAVGMARPGLKNASHQEVKDLVQDIITAQTSEIAQMKQWQSEWGYAQ